MVFDGFFTQEKTMRTLEEKYINLQNIIRNYDRLAIAFSGGVDSTFLLKVARDVLLDNVVAITARSVSFPEREHKESEDFCKVSGIKQIVVDVDQMSIEGFKNNPPDRCYLCKKVIFETIIESAKQLGIDVVAEGSNADDVCDYRPGMRAIAELKVKSPLKEADLSKDEIRTLSKELGLPTWSKPSFACLATRFVYGQEITEEKIKMAGKAEELLFDLGFTQARCRVHENMARIEIMQDEFEKILQNDIRTRIAKEIKALGFSYVALDLQGYRTGSMNETLNITG
ncbi:ATP-dependent sacrificial sulfur transferase LarE [Butyrivibrio sp. AE3004]|uniref:ATP-dependent sacrificial sulfur transferase LarE n=1 Tax=Butyrivibrio sp. AE3004 TaxID=1506994 RepID=UPI000A86EEA9|nr:ATP-dependent sacrificial sulfur transferase LarE [Butyrivibrio sp. AE3004]